MKKTMSGMFIAILLVAIASVGVVSAIEGNAMKNNGGNLAQDCADNKDVFETQDFAAWKTLMLEKGKSGKILEVVSEETFPLFVQLREARILGDTELTLALREELGLSIAKKERVGLEKNKGFGNQHHKEQNQLQKRNLR